MTSRDPASCRRALREIGEIAAVAVLDGSQMSEQEALQTISAIAEWVSDNARNDGAECGDRIHALSAMTDGVDFDALDDGEALDLFRAVLKILRGQDASVTA